jgi:cell division protease FtsH
MATSMVKAYGMSDKLGPVSFDKGRPLFLETPWSQPKEYSESTAKEIDEEVKQILTESFSKAKTVLGERVEKLKQIAAVLLEKEVLEGDELKRLVEQ